VRFATPLEADARAPLASANPLARIGAAAIMMLSLFLAVDAVTPLLVLIVVAAAIPLSGVKLRLMLRRAWPILAAAVVVGLLNAFFAEPRGNVLVHIGPVALRSQSLLAGAALGLRIMGIAMAGVVALATVDPTDLADALMQQLRVSPRFAVGALAAVRLIPSLAEEWQMLALARRARGLQASSPLSWLRLALGRLMALLVSAIRRATRLALAMEARGLGSGRRRTVARPQRFTGRDWMVLAASGAAGAAASGISLLLGSYRFLFG
jgi:energy-coupling factor transport system permease protein